MFKYFILILFTKATYDPGAHVLMKNYAKNYRTYDCWECFNAQGKMCHDIDQQSMIKVTGSSNFGHAVCCKPGFNGDHCTTDDKHICSEPAGYEETKQEFKSILTGGTLNHQLFAFCPKTSPQRCGFKS